MVITNAAFGFPPVASCLASTASTTSPVAHTSNGLGRTGINTTSAAPTASALILEVPGGPSTTTQP